MKNGAIQYDIMKTKHHWMFKHWMFKEALNSKPMFFINIEMCSFKVLKHTSPASQMYKPFLTFKKRFYRGHFCSVLTGSTVPLPCTFSAFSSHSKPDSTNQFQFSALSELQGCVLKQGDH